MGKKEVKYFSMFSGIGGFELGIQQAYENKDSGTIERSSGGHNLQSTGDSPNLSSAGGKQQWGKPTCIGYSEIDKYAIKIYNKHFNHQNYGNATTINPATLPDFDLICGGFPCQAFSIAGKRGGFDDTRGTLFFDIARIARVKRPRLLFLENVKGLLSHDGGRTFDTIIRAIDELGYDVQWQVLNSKNFGVPQNRERVFIIGHLRGTSRPQVFPFGENDRATDEGSKQGVQQIANTLRARDYASWRGNHLKEITKGERQGSRIYDPAGISQTLASTTGGKGGKTGLYAVPAQWRRTEKGKTARRESQKQGKDLTPFGDGNRELVPKESNTIGTITASATAKDSLLFDQMKIRRLTPTECERLQGYPDGWTEGISDTQRYKTLGNSVTVNVIQAVAEKLLSSNP